MDLTLKDDASEAFTVDLKDKFGVETSAAVGLTVASSDETVAVGTLSTDGSTLTVSAAGQGKLGATVITLTDAADNLTATLNVTVVAGAPASIGLTPVTTSTESTGATTASTTTAETAAASSTTAQTDAAPAADAAGATDAAGADAAAPAADASSGASTEAAAS